MICFGGGDSVVLIITTFPVRATVGLLVMVLGVLEDDVSALWNSVVEDAGAVVDMVVVVTVVDTLMDGLGVGS